MLSESALGDLQMPAELTNILIMCLAGPVGKGYETQVRSKADEGRKLRVFYIYREKAKYK